MKKRILAVSHNAALLETRRLLLEKLGHEVFSILDFDNLTRHLSERGCDLAVLGFSIPSQEKKRVAWLIRQYSSDCPIVELFLHSPEIPDATVHVHNDDGPEALLNAVRSQLESDTRSDAASSN